jgi:hypothetical protein
MKTLNRLKEIATLLLKNWLAGTPESRALMRLADSRRERERISENNGFFECSQTVYSYCAFFAGK